MSSFDMSVQLTLQVLQAMPGIELKQIAMESGLDLSKLEMNCEKLFVSPLINLANHYFSRVLKHSFRIVRKPRVQLAPELCFRFIL